MKVQIIIICDLKARINKNMPLVFVSQNNSTICVRIFYKMALYLRPFHMIVTKYLRMQYVIMLFFGNKQ